jgi:hypothetical protein|tara:strand:- start:312 stop:446 length:135 start_codon:yes stop_codon:yes gene_type:complete
MVTRHHNNHTRAYLKTPLLVKNFQILGTLTKKAARKELNISAST